MYEFNIFLNIFCLIFFDFKILLKFFVILDISFFLYGNMINDYPSIKVPMSPPRFMNMFKYP